MQPSDISWTTYTWNPVTGCSKIGPECTNCWAEAFSHRQGRTSEPWTHEHADANVTVHEDRLDEPRTYGYPDGDGFVFVVSMGDLFHRKVGVEFIERVLEVARDCPRQVFQFLTKRPDRAAELRLDWPENAWVGTSVGSGPGGDYPNTTHRIEQLRDVDAHTRWVSFEPLVEPIGTVALDHIDWMVVGGETGPADVRREMEHAWARELLTQARQHDVAYWFKQSSGRYPETNPYLTVPRGGVDVQVELHEYPEVPEITERARAGLEAWT